jgi:hypothetical protein
VTRDFGQAARYAWLVIAPRVPVYFSIGIATAVTAGLAALRPAPPVPSAPELPTATPVEPLEMHWQDDGPACDRDAITAIVIRGQFTSRERSHEGFAISFAGSSGRYTAMTDARGYFEVHMPREDFAADPCALPLTYRDFSDKQMTLRYRIDVER